MILEERDEGDYRIYGGAVEAVQGGGHIAALVVLRHAASGPREAFRDEAVAGGHRWAMADEALRYAICKGREVVRTERHRLRC
jgi:hypothetical protein